MNQRIIDICNQVLDGAITVQEFNNKLMIYLCEQAKGKEYSIETFDVAVALITAPKK